jgi:tRNA nucleotidyltransferase (CCA-adding enzyme)
MNANLKKILEDERAILTPTSQEAFAVKNAASDFIGRLGKALRFKKIAAIPILGGSGEKGTWLKGMHDIDVFVCFDYAKFKDRSGELSDFLASAMKKSFKKYERIHGSRDYFRISCDGYNFEAVPILKITRSSQAKNITDASILHSEWVKKQIRKQKGLDDEIRLTKAFARAHDFYGAESYVRGLSGYACEVLASYYGGFLGFAKFAATKWKRQIASGKKIIVDAQGYYKKRDVLSELNEAKVQSELIVIDPIQANRNATAALSNEKLGMIVKAAAAFISQPSTNFFEKEIITEKLLREKAKGRHIVLVEAGLAKGKEDIIGARFLKAFEYIKEKVEKSGFKVIETGWDWDKKEKAILWVITKDEAPFPEIREGPPVTNIVHSDNFRKEHSGKKGREIFEENGKLYARIERRHKKTANLLADMIKNDSYIKDKAVFYRLK